jgi:hypothetical protein
VEQAGCHRACCCWPQGAYTCRVGWPDQPGHHVSTRGTCTTTQWCRVCSTARVLVSCSTAWLRTVAQCSQSPLLLASRDPPILAEWAGISLDTM